MTAEASTGTQVIQRNNARLVLLFLGSAIFAAMCAWVRLSGEAARSVWLSPDDVQRLLLFGNIFFTICALVALLLMIKSGPAMTFDEEGVAIYGAFGKPSRLAWEEIDSVFDKLFRNQHFIVFKLRDSDGYRARQSARIRPAITANQRALGGEVTIAAVMLRARRAQLLADLQARLERSRAARSPHIPAEAGAS